MVFESGEKGAEYYVEAPGVALSRDLETFPLALEVFWKWLDSGVTRVTIMRNVWGCGEVMETVPVMTTDSTLFDEVRARRQKALRG